MKKGTVIGIIIAIIIVIAIIAGIAISKNSNKTATTGNTNESELGINEKSTNDSENLVANDEGENENVNEKNTNSSSNKKVLVVYYSAQSHTKKVAERIAKNLDADTFVIEPKDEYTFDDLNWNNSDSRVVKEHEDESLRNVELKTTDVPNWDDYDIVLIGYPIWWGIAAWPTDTFVKANDFTGKTVIPFCTSYSSGLGQSAKLIQNEAKGGDWKDGQRFKQDASDSDIDDWTSNLNL